MAALHAAPAAPRIAVPLKADTAAAAAPSPRCGERGMREPAESTVSPQLAVIAAAPTKDPNDDHRTLPPHRHRSRRTG